MILLLLKLMSFQLWGQNQQIPLPNFSDPLAQQAVQQQLNQKFSVFGGTVSNNVNMTTTTVNELCFYSDGSCMTSSGGTGAPFWAASGTSIHNTNTGNVGINNSNPGARLTVNDSNTLQTIVSSNTGGGTGGISITGSNENTWSWYEYSANNSCFGIFGITEPLCLTPLSEIDLKGPVTAISSVTIAAASGANILQLGTTSTTWTWSFQNHSNLASSTPFLQLHDNNNQGLDFGLLDMPGGQRLTLWDGSPLNPGPPGHGGGYEALMIHGDIRVGDIIAILTNPMTYFMRQSTAPFTSPTQLFSNGAINDDTIGGAGIVYAPVDNQAGGASNDGYINLTAFGRGGGSLANTIYFQNRGSANTAQVLATINSGGMNTKIGADTVTGQLPTAITNSMNMDFSGGDGRLLAVGNPGYAPIQVISNNGTTSRVLSTWDGTNQRLGVLTGSPATTLDVFGSFQSSSSQNGTIQVPSQNSNFSASGIFMQALANTPFIAAQLGTANTSSSFSVYSSNAGTPLFTMLGNGDFGINKLTPTHTFENVGTFMSSSTSNGMIDIPADDSNFSATGVFTQAFSGKPFIADKLGTSDTGSSFAVYSNGNTNLFAVRGDGNVGINIFNPSYKLDVQGGDINASGVFRDGGTAGVTISACSTGVPILAQATAGGITTAGACGQAVNSGAAPTFTGTNFSGIPSSAVTVNSTFTVVTSGFTNATADVLGKCVTGSTITFTTSGGSIRVTHSGSGIDSTSAGVAAGFLMDGNFTGNFTKTLAAAYAGNAAVGGFGGDISFTAKVVSPSSASHSFCLTFAPISAGTATYGGFLGAFDVQGYFEAVEVNQ